MQPQKTGTYFLLIFIIFAVSSIKIEAIQTLPFYAPYCGNCRSYIPKNIDIIKSPIDNCQYFIYEALNQAKLLVVEDSRRGEVINLEIGFSVGSLMDPSKYYGLAHYLQHMIFRGSQNFDQKQRLTSYIQLNSGQFNAYTSLQKTSYFFQINQNFFKHTYSMMFDGLQFPLFHPQSAQKQISAIDQEFHLAKNNNGHKFFQLLALNTFKQQYKRFPPGNKQILTSNGTVSYQQLSQQLKKFHRKFYSANRAKGVLYMKHLNLDIVEQVLKQIQKFKSQQNFSQVVKGQFNSSLIDLETHDYYMVNHTVQKGHIIKGFIFPYQQLENKKVHVQQHQHIKLLNYILNTYLAKKIMKAYPQVNYITFQCDNLIGDKYPLIQLDINLLKNDSDTQNLIGKKLFNLINYYLERCSAKKLKLAQSHLQNQMKVQFHNQGYKRDDVISFVNWLSARMQNIGTNYQQLIQQQYKFQRLKSYQKNKQLQKIKYKLYFMEMKGNSVGASDQFYKTKYFQTVFKNVDHLSSETSHQVSQTVKQFQLQQYHQKRKQYQNSYVQEQIKSLQLKQNIQAKKKNITVDTKHKKTAISVQKKSQTIKNQIKLFLLQDQDNGRTNSEFIDDKASIILSLSYEEYKTSSQNQDLFIMILFELIQRQIYHQRMLAQKILPQIKIIGKLKHQMIIFKTVGPIKSSLRFLQNLVKTVKNEVFTQELFEIKKKNIKSSCQGYKIQRKPLSIVIQEFDRFVNTKANLHSCQQILKIIQSYTYKGFTQQRNKFQQSFKLKWTIISNIETQHEALQIIENSVIFKQTRKYQSNYRQVDKINDIIRKINKNTSQIQAIRRIVLPDTQPNIILAYYNAGQINITNFLTTKIIAKILNQKLFNILRSQKQLAYTTFAQQYLLSSNQIGLIMFIASNYHPVDTLKEQMQNVVMLISKQLSNSNRQQKLIIQEEVYSDEMFNTLKQSILKQLLRKKQNLIQNSDDYSYYLELCPSCLIQWKLRYKEEIQKITKQTIVQELSRIIGQNYNKVWILSQKPSKTVNIQNDFKDFTL